MSNLFYIKNIYTIITLHQYIFIFIFLSNEYISYVSLRSFMFGLRDSEETVTEGFDNMLVGKKRKKKKRVLSSY